MPRKLAVAALLWITFGDHPAAAEALGCYRVVNVDMWDVLYIRSREDYRSRANGAIAPDTTATIKAEGPCRPAGSSPRRQWCPVTYHPLPGVAISGFVKRYFVRPAACAPGQG